MSNLTDEEAAAMREQLADYDRHKAYEAAMQCHALYLDLKPIVESPEFAALRQQIADLREDGPKDNLHFSIHMDAMFHGMSGLGMTVTNWQAPVNPGGPAPEPAPTPTPEPEGDGDVD